MVSRRVAVLVFDGVTMLDVAGPTEVFSRVRDYEIVVVSPAGGDVATSSGLRLGETAPVASLVGAEVDTVMVAGGDRLVDGSIDPGLREAARALVGRARRVTSVCTGAFVLAEIGALDGRRATTHWRRARTLAHRYPALTVEPDAIFVRDGPVITSAGISAGIDLALAVVEDDHGPQTARDVARELVVFLQRPGGQSQFSVAERTPVPRHPVLRTLLDRIVAAPASDHSLTGMAASAGVSTRHLARLFREATGTTPARWVEQVRVELAQQLLLEDAPVALAADRSGLGSDETLRRAFARHLGVTPTEYRNRFRAAGATSGAKSRADRRPP